jgi:hypothetical protein
MELITLLGAAISGAVLTWFFKPYLEGYGGEKGKTLARKEDLEPILNEVRAVAKEQKQIESYFTHRAWVAQKLWDERRSAYFSSLEWLNLMEDEAIKIPEDEDQFRTALDRILLAQVPAYRRARVQTNLFIGEKADEIWLRLGSAFVALIRHNAPRDLLLGEVRVAKETFVSLARTDFGIDAEVEGAMSNYGRGEVV